LDNSTSLHPQVEPLAVSAATAAKLFDLSRSMWFRLNAAGKVPQPIYFGRVPRWLVEELRAWAAAGQPDRQSWLKMREGQQ
jgi:predicted DNA-binding transcriptional regulator AlpA